MTKGLLHFHQGWTDIINCLSLIDYYLESNYELTVVSRQYAKDIIEFYIRDKKNVQVAYTLSDDTDSLAISLANTDSYKLLFHGFHDNFRTIDDPKRGCFGSKFRSHGADHFVKLFYEAYDIPYIKRIEKFNICRDVDLENKEYNKFIESNGSEYILYHGDYNSRNISIFDSNCKLINLNGITNNIFSYIKILQYSKELHLIDSIWASFCYLLDARYGLFKDKKIYLYPFFDRSGGCVPTQDTRVLDPLHLDNWFIIN